MAQSPLAHRLIAAMLGCDVAKSHAAHRLHVVPHAMEHSRASHTPEILLDGTELEDIELAGTEPTTQVALAVDEVAYLRGWSEAMHAARATLLQRADGSKLDEYYVGWIDGVTQQSADAARLAGSRYAHGYAAGCQQRELAQRGGCDAGGYDAE